MKKISLAVIATAVLFTGCNMESSTKQEAKKQEQMKLQADMTVSMPAIVNFQEKRMAKDILEMRDKQITTVTYTVDLNGKLHKLCDSIGFGLPYSTQYTNPQKADSYSGNPYTMPQADPNGLYMPESADGTWVICKDPKSTKVAPIYVEPRVIISPFELEVK